MSISLEKEVFMGKVVALFLGVVLLISLQTALGQEKDKEKLELKYAFKKGQVFHYKCIRKDKVGTDKGKDYFNTLEYVLKYKVENVDENGVATIKRSTKYFTFEGYYGAGGKKVSFDSRKKKIIFEGMPPLLGHSCLLTSRVTNLLSDVRFKVDSKGNILEHKSLGKGMQNQTYPVGYQGFNDTQLPHMVYSLPREEIEKGKSYESKDTKKRTDSLGVEETTTVKTKVHFKDIRRIENRECAEISTEITTTIERKSTRANVHVSPGGATTLSRTFYFDAKEGLLIKSESGGLTVSLEKIEETKTDKKKEE
jgi:hypothetical protein